MKITIFLILFFSILVGSLFPLSETLITFGYELENDFEFSTNNDTWSYMNSSGINLGINKYWDGYNIGLFVQQSFLFPTFSDVKNISGSVPFVVKDFDFMFKYNIIIGPSFRLTLSDYFLFNIGTGFSFSYLLANMGANFSQKTSGYLRELNSLFFGLGMNVNINYYVSDIMYIGIGSIFIVNFDKYSIDHWSGTSYPSNESDQYFSMITDNWLGFSCKPYLYIGFCFYNNSINMGKPKNKTSS